jgi:hypothetical protein
LPDLRASLSAMRSSPEREEMGREKREEGHGGANGCVGGGGAMGELQHWGGQSTFSSVCANCCMRKEERETREERRK